MEAVLASRNAGKLREMQALLAPAGWTLRRVSDFTADAPEETAPDFAGNALLKARHAAAVSGLPAIADDSGLAVDALDGGPGVRSARYAGEGATDAANNRKLLEALAGVPEDDRGAEFVCAMAYVRGAADPAPVLVEARWRGIILPAARGVNGFGYDPLFFVPAHGCSSAELSAKVKNRISHRGQAARMLLALLRDSSFVMRDS